MLVPFCFYIASFYLDKASSGTGGGEAGTTDCPPGSSGPALDFTEEQIDISVVQSLTRDVCKMKKYTSCIACFIRRRKKKISFVR